MDETIRVVSLRHLSHIEWTSLRLCIGILDTILDISVEDTFASRHWENLACLVRRRLIEATLEALHLQLFCFTNGASVTISLTVNVTEGPGVSFREHERVVVSNSRT